MHDTAAAERVSFLLDFGLPSKDELSEEQQLAANVARVNSLPVPRWQLLCDGSVSAGSETEDPSSGAAALLQRVDADGSTYDVRVAQRQCGVYACSYTAESHAIIMGLELAAAEMADDLPLCIISDSMGQLACLATGPCRQTEYLPMRTWAWLLHLAYRRHITFAFVFSHCGFEVHDRIDAFAAEARRSITGPPPVWWRDAARPARNAIRVDHDRAVWTEPNFRNSFGPDTAVDPLLRLPMREAAVINRLRAGVDPELAGWRQRVQEPCPLCDTRLGRGIGETNGVVHFASCTHPEARSARTERGVQRFVRYRRDFVAACATRAASRASH
jgi:hypothetical protein